MPSRMVVFEDVTATWFASALGVATHLRIAELVPEKGGCAVSELAPQCDMVEAALRRLLVATGACAAGSASNIAGLCSNLHAAVG